MPGDFKPLRNALGHLSSPDLGTRLRGAIAVQAERELLRGFRQSVDPWGDPWDAVARGGKPLMDTGALRGSRVSVPTGDGVEVGLAAPYASYQQFGTTRIRRRRAASPRRQSVRRGGYLGLIRPRAMLPMKRGRAGLGTWGPAFEKVTKRVLRQRSK